MAARMRRETATVLHDSDTLHVSMTTGQAGYVITVSQPPTGITVTGKGASRTAAGKDARERFHAAFIDWKARRLVDRYARDEKDELELLQMLFLEPYEAGKRTMWTAKPVKKSAARGELA